MPDALYAHFITLIPGTRLGHYEITGRIGAGGMGEVFRGRDPRIGREVAIKILSKDLAKDAEQLHRFEQEVHTAGTLNHPHLVTIYDIGEEEGSPYIVMELLDGATLREHFPAPGGNIQPVLRWLAEVCEGIAAAHEAGVIHRDLKPENIIVTKAGYAKALDFGLAKPMVPEDVTSPSATAARMTDPGTIVGTIDYMSPEQAAGRRLDQRSDIFSLGSILFEALTGQLPFDGETSIDKLHRILRADPPPLSAFRKDLPPELQHIVTRCLAKDPNARYQSAKELAVDLRTAAHPSMRIVVPTADRRWLGHATIAAAVALMLGLVVWIAARRTHDDGTAQLRIAPITTNGNVIGAAVSPDGKYAATIISDAGMQSLWLRQIGTTQGVDLVPPAPVAYWGVSFSPDGTTIDYLVRSKKEWSGIVYRIGTLGGPPRTILTGADSGTAFSRDGKRIAWCRDGYPRSGESALMIANADGTGARALAVRKAPELFAPIFWSKPAWSPDGIAIATPVSSGTTTRLMLFDTRTGAATPIGRAWTFAAHPSLLPDGRSLLLVASEGQRLRTQIWQMAVPSGDARRITHDFSSYRTIDVTADGRAAVGVTADIWSSVWINRAGQAPVKIAAEHTDGFSGVAAGADRIIYTVLNESADELWTVMRDGSGRQALLGGQESRSFPVLTHDGRHVLYQASGPNGESIDRIDVDGANHLRLARASSDSTPTVSPDDRNVYFNADLGGGTMLYRAGIDGGTAVVVSHLSVSRPAVSPDGRSIAAIVRVTPNEQPSIAILDAITGALVRRLAFEISMTFPEVHWSADGRYILFNSSSRIARVPAAGGAVETVLAADRVFHFDVAPDGAIVTARGALTRDAVQLAGFE